MSAGEQLRETLGQLGAVIEGATAGAAVGAASAVRDDLARMIERALEARSPMVGPAPFPYLTAEDVRELFRGIAAKTLWKWRRREVDPFPAPVQLADNTFVFVRAEIDAWVARQPRAFLGRSSSQSAA